MSVGCDWALQDASKVTRYRAVAAAVGVAGTVAAGDVTAVGPAGDEPPQPARATRTDRARKRFIGLLLDQDNARDSVGIPRRSSCAQGRVMKGTRRARPVAESLP